MVINKLNNIEFRLNVCCDLSWLKKYGEAFTVIDETGSGCICIGMQSGSRRFFCKVAGADTIDADVSPSEAIRFLKDAMHIYDSLRHPNLIKLIEHYQHENLYAAVFEWADGECLFDHWNFEKYSKDRTLIGPRERFKALPVDKKLDACEVVFSFMAATAQQGYVAVDFYDGSIMYDFRNNITTICDIDFFQKTPVVNSTGMDWFGTKRLKAPEEYIKGAVIDESTNVFTLGAMIFDFFGQFTNDEINMRYAQNRFSPCARSLWQLGDSSYSVALKAVDPDRRRRYKTISSFWADWNASLREEFKA